IEVGLVRLAARERPSAEGLARCADILDQMRESADDWDAYIALDLRFHREVAVLAGSQTLLLLLDSMEGVFRQARLASYAGRKSRGLDIGTVAAEHQAILDAVGEADADQAVASMMAHLEATLSDLR